MFFVLAFLFVPLSVALCNIASQVRSVNGVTTRALSNGLALDLNVGAQFGTVEFSNLNVPNGELLQCGLAQGHDAATNIMVLRDEGTITIGGTLQVDQGLNVILHTNQLAMEATGNIVANGDLGVCFSDAPSSLLDLYLVNVTSSIVAKGGGSDALYWIGEGRLTSPNSNLNKTGPGRLIFPDHLVPSTVEEASSKGLVLSQVTAPQGGTFLLLTPSGYADAMDAMRRLYGEFVPVIQYTLIEDVGGAIYIRSYDGENVQDVATDVLLTDSLDHLADRVVALPSAAAVNQRGIVEVSDTSLIPVQGANIDGGRYESSRPLPDAAFDPTSPYYIPPDKHDAYFGTGLPVDLIFIAMDVSRGVPVSDDDVRTLYTTLTLEELALFGLQPRPEFTTYTHDERIGLFDTIPQEYWDTAGRLQLRDPSLTQEEIDGFFNGLSQDQLNVLGFAPGYRLEIDSSNQGVSGGAGVNDPIFTTELSIADGGFEGNDLANFTDFSLSGLEDFGSAELNAGFDGGFNPEAELNAGFDGGYPEAELNAGFDAGLGGDAPGGFDENGAFDRPPGTEGLEPEGYDQFGQPVIYDQWGPIVIGPPEPGRAQPGFEPGGAFNAGGAPLPAAEPFGGPNAGGSPLPAAEPFGGPNAGGVPEEQSVNGPDSFEENGGFIRPPGTEGREPEGYDQFGQPVIYDQWGPIVIGPPEPGRAQPGFEPGGAFNPAGGPPNAGGAPLPDIPSSFDPANPNPNAPRSFRGGARTGLAR